MAPSTLSRFRISDLSASKPTAFEITLSASQAAAMAQDLNLLALRKVRFAGTLAPMGTSDWQLSGDLGATVVQPCSVTLDPVTTRIEEPVRRMYLANMPEPDAGEVEMPQDDTIDPLPDAFDLLAILQEALTIALPAFPRAPGADLGEAVFGPDGVAPLRDQDTRPFAGLKSLKDQMKKPD